MSESSLSITRTDLRRAVGRYAGFAPDPDNWTDDEISVIDDAIKSGERSFYAPMVLPNERTAHAWSWLRPVLTLSLRADQGDYDLPDLFGGFVGNLYFSGADTALDRPLRQVGIGEILANRQLAAATNLSTQPDRYAVQLLPQTGEVPQRFAIAFWPTPNTSYTLSGQYFINPYAVSSTEPYPLGGQPHAETLRQSCLAAAEREINDERGLQYQTYMERLTASVSLDRKQSGPAILGHNGDGASTPSRYERLVVNDRVYYNGVDYSGLSN